MSPRSVVHTTAGRPTMDGNGVPLTRVLPSPGLRMVDPFLMLDHFGPLELPADSTAGFPPHPHKGFMTYTYMLQGAFRHRDSRGGHGILAPGGAQLMVAGSGIVHEEMPLPEHLEKGGAIEGFQLWVNLAAAHKGQAPRYQDLPAEAMPWRELEGGRLKALAGSWLGGADPIDVPTEWAYAHLELLPGARFEHAVPAGWNAALFVLHGVVDAAGTALVQDQLAVLSAEGEGFALHATEAAAVLLLMGRPLGEPVAQYGPFVMNSPEELEQAVRAYQAGEMGVLA